MADPSIRDVEYTHGETRLSGLICAPEVSGPLPTVVLVHDAFGLAEEMIEIARRIAGLGFAVFAADVWGDRRTPAMPEIGPLIGGMVGDRAHWLERIALAFDVAAQQPETNDQAPIGIGYCFGGSSVLEHARTGGKVRGVAAIHPGLDLIETDWSAVTPATAPSVYICFGASDPMATPEQWRPAKDAMTEPGVDWELNL